jgi:hypothetical protein
MRRTIAAVALASAFTVVPAASAFATTPPADPNDVEAIDNPLDENDSSGFDDWGLFGLVGLLGLAGLKRRNDTYTRVDDRVGTR